MEVTKTRVIYGDAIVLIALAALYFATDHLTKDVFGMCLVIVLLLGRSIFFHVNYYKATGKLY